MYRKFFGLQERPFDLTVNPRFLFLSSSHREALSLLRYGLEAEKGLTLLIGEAGTGKTTLLRAALDEQRGSRLFCIYLTNPVLTREEFYQVLADEFRLGRSAAQSKSWFLREFQQVLADRRRAGGLTTLVVDEAQSLPLELLEELRLLANFETATTKLLSVILAGQPELAERLNDPVLRPFKQRVALRTKLMPFDVRETAAYVAKRVKVAGGDAATIFTREAIEAIHFSAQGIPRVISVVCDNALVSAFAQQVKPIDADVIAEVCRDLDLSMGVPLLERQETTSSDPSHGRETTGAPGPLKPVLLTGPSSAADDVDTMTDDPVSASGQWSRGVDRGVS